MLSTILFVQLRWKINDWSYLWNSSQSLLPIYYPSTRDNANPKTPKVRRRTAMYQDLLFGEQADQVSANGN